MLNYEQAIGQLPGILAQQDTSLALSQLKALAFELSAAANRPNAILFSGMLDGVTKAQTIARSLADAHGLAIISDTERVRFIESSGFTNAFDEIMLRSGASPDQIKSLRANFFYGDNGFWKVTSSDFVKSVTGSIIPLVQNAGADSVFAVVEVKDFLYNGLDDANAKFGTIHKSELRALFEQATLENPSNPDAGRLAVLDRLRSDARLSLNDGIVAYDALTGNAQTRFFLTHEAAARFGFVQGGYSVADLVTNSNLKMFEVGNISNLDQVHWNTDYSKISFEPDTRVVTLNKFATSLKAVGIAGALYDIYSSSIEAEAQRQNGQNEEAILTLTKLAARLYFGWQGAIAGAAVGGSLAAPSGPFAFASALIGGVAGGVIGTVGGEAAVEQIWAAARAATDVLIGPQRRAQIIVTPNLEAYQLYGDLVASGLSPDDAKVVTGLAIEKWHELQATNPNITLEEATHQLIDDVETNQGLAPSQDVGATIGITDSEVGQSYAFVSESGQPLALAAWNPNGTFAGISLDGDGAVDQAYYADNEGRIRETLAVGEPDRVPWRTKKTTYSTNGQVAAIEFKFTTQTLGSIGSIFGSALGRSIAGDNQFAQIASGTVVGAIGQTLAQGIGVTLGLDGAKHIIVSNVFDQFGVNLAGAAIGAVTSFLTAELGEALGLEGFGAQLFNTSVSSYAGSILNQVLLPGADGQLAALFTGNLNWGAAYTNALNASVGAIGGVLGSYLANEILAPENQAGAMGGQLGGAIGMAIGASFVNIASGIFLNFLVPGLGAFVGTLLGTLFGNLFGGPEDIIGGYAWIALDPDKDRIATTHYYGIHASSDTAVALSMTNSVRDVLNGYLDAVDGESVVASYKIGLAYEIIHGDLHYRYEYAPNHFQYFGDAELAVKTAMLQGMHQLKIAGGELLLKRGVERSSANSITTLAGDLQIAQDYARYLNDRESINALILLNPDSAFTAGWAITLARAAELGLTAYGTSDFIGGLRGFVSSLDLPSLGADYSDVSIAGDAQGQFIVDVRIAQSASVPGVFDIYASTVEDLQIDGSRVLRFTFDNGLAPAGYSTLTGGTQGAGTWTVYGAAGSNDLWLGRDDLANIYNANDSGSLGDDILVGGALNDVIQAGTGWDWVVGGGGNDQLYGGEGRDVLRGDAGDDLLDGGYQADQLIGGTGADTIKGSGGDDTYIFGRGDGTDTLIEDYRYNVTDTHIIHHPAVTVGENTTPAWDETVYITREVHGNGGADTLQFAEGITASHIAITLSGSDLIVGVKDPANPSATFSQLTDRITLKNWINAIDRIEQIRFSDGTVLGVAEIVSRLGTDVGDTITWTESAVTLNGGDGNDILTGSPFSDTLNGGAGNDTLNGGASTDTMAGGAGDDIIVVDHAGDIVIENVNEGLDTVRTALGSYTLADNVENLTGLSGAGQTLTGNSLANALIGSSGNDILIGGAGNDVLSGGAGADSLRGGADDDSYFVDHASDGVIENADEGVDTVNTALATYALSANVENLVGISTSGQTLTGSALANTITAGNGNDVIDGGTGADTLVGRGGNDIYIVDDAGDVVTEMANEGTDTVQTSLASYTLAANVENLVALSSSEQALTGNALGNEITGAAGADTLAGGEGADSLKGGAGNDLYVFNRGDGADMVLDEDRTSVTAEQLMWSGTTSRTNFLNQAASQGYTRTVTHSEWQQQEGIGENVTWVTYGNYSGYKMVITETWNDGGTDTLSFGPGITAADVMISLSGNNLIVGIKDPANPNATFAQLTDKITLQNWMLVKDRIESFQFENGSSLNVAAIVGRIGTEAADSVTWTETAVTLNGQAGNDTLTTGGFSDTLEGGAGNDSLNAGAGDDTLQGGVGDDQLDGGTGTDVLSGGSGNDVLLGAAGDDTLDGGADSDALRGGAGNDTYVFGIGSGADTINNIDGGTDRVLFGAGIAASDLIFTPVGNHLQVRINGTTDSLTITNWFLSSSYRVASFELANGTTVPVSISVIGTASAETLNGTASGDSITGLAGADTLNGLGGNDTLEGGLDNDTLKGGAGNDTYVFNRGDGADSVLDEDKTGEIVEQLMWSGTTSRTNFLNQAASQGYTRTVVHNEWQQQEGTGENAPWVTYGTYSGYKDVNTEVWNDGGTDVLSFGAGITAADVVISLSGNNLIVGIKDLANPNATFAQLTDKITLQNWMLFKDRIESFQFEDGSSLNVAGIVGKIGTENADSVTWTETAVTLSGQAGNDTLTSGAFNDTLIGGAGADTLNGAGGTDTASYETSSAGVTVSLVAGASNTGGDAQGDVLSNIENLTGSAFNDTLTGNAAANILNGASGDDTINGGDGNDDLSGGTGNDSINGGAGADVVRFFGARSDYIVTYNSATQTYTVQDTRLNGDGTDTVTATETFQFADGARLAANVADAVPSNATLSGNSVLENAAVGTVIGTVAGVSTDAWAVLTYALTNDAGGRFAIDAQNGALSVAGGGLLDLEGASSHEIVVRVTNQAGLIFDKSFTIGLSNENEAPTNVALSSTTIAENAGEGVALNTALGVDPDAGSVLTYSLVDDAGGLFTIDANTGQLSLAAGASFDYETANSHDLTVRVTDQDGLTFDKAFTLNVTDINEAPGNISLSNSAISENAANGTVVGTVAATDPDSGAALTYLLLDNAGNRFTLDSTTGQLRVIDAAPLDLESKASHEVVVQVTDQHGASVSKTFTINLTNVNEAPSNACLSGNSIAENAANGSVIGTVSGTDVDAGAVLSYSLTDDAGGRFAINATTGELTVADGGLLNYESATSHNVTVRVTDQGGLTFDKTLTINLTDVNESAPTDAVLSANGIAENATIGSAVGTVSGTDPDGTAVLAYTLTNDAGGRFAINATTGELSVADGGLLNYEAATSHEVTVRVTDQGGLAFDKTFTINLTNVNEAPSNANLSGNSIAENAANGSVVGTVSGTDVDAGATLSYSLTNDAGGRFAINATTGELTVANSGLLNYEAATSHEVTIRVTDQGGLTYDKTFTINLTNINEAPSNASLSGNSIAENAANGGVVGTVSGADVDAGAVLSYSLTDDAGGRFAIHATSGELTVADGGLLNYESAVSHEVTVRVTDQGGLTFDKTFTINLTDVNESAPTNAVLSANAIAENAATGSAVGTVSGTDPDGTAVLSYALTNDAGGRFAINATTGELTVADGGLLNYESAVSHEVTVRVTDQGGLTFDKAFTINLTNINEAPSNASLSGNSIAEHAANGSVAGSVSGTDVDAGAVLSYSLTDDAGGRFAINATTGELTVANSGLLDYESAMSHEVTVRVTDQGGLTFDKTFTINLTNVNEAPSNASLSGGSVAEKTDIGTVVGSVTGVDADASSVLSYALLDNAGGRFAIHSSSGLITVANGPLLDYDAATSHTIVVRVTDQTGLTFDKVFTITVTDTLESSVSYTLNATTQNLTLIGASPISGTGNALNNTIKGNSANNTLSGLAGNDTLDGGGGADTLIGGTGDDTYYVDYAGDVVSEAASEGLDRVFASVSYTLTANVENLFLTGTSGVNGTGNSLANLITGNSGSNILDGLAGHDTLAGATGADTLKGGAGNDTYVFNRGDGTDTVLDEDKTTQITEQLMFSGTMKTSDYNNQAYWNGYTRTVVHSEWTQWESWGESGSWVSYGNYSGYKNFTTEVWNDAGTDVLSFGAGITAADVVISLSGNNLIVGIKDPANPNATFAQLTDKITLQNWMLVKDRIESFQFEDGSSLNVAGIVGEIGTENADSVTWTETAVTLNGQAGNDTLTSGAFNDTLIGGSGADTLNGAGGTDTASYETSSAGVTVSLVAGASNTGGDAQGDVLSNIENLTGSAFNDTLTGNTSANVLSGGAGNDTLNGGGSADTMIGAAGDDIYFVDQAGDVVTENANEGFDTIFSDVSLILAGYVEALSLNGTASLNGTGNNLANFLYGTSGNNTLNGGSGADVMYGKAGNDTYVIDDTSDTIVENANEGTDAAQASASYSLGANVETLTLTGSGGINGTGNNLANTITGNSGNNILDGGAGNDTLIGGGGYDTYKLGVGGGQDIVTNGNGGATALSELEIGAGISAEQIWLKQSGNNLIIQFMGTQDQATIQNWYGSTDAQLQKITTDDGHILDTQLNQLVQAMASYSTSNPGFDPSATSQAPADSNLQNAIAAAWHQ